MSKNRLKSVDSAGNEHLLNNSKIKKMMIDQKFSILETIEQIHDELINETVKICSYRLTGTLQTLTETLGAEMKTSPLSALHFAAVFCLTLDEDTVHTRDITRLLKVPVSKMNIFSKEIDMLIDAGFMFRHIGYASRTEYGIPMDVRKKIFEDKVPEKLNLATDIFGFDEFVGKYMYALEHNKSQYDHIETSAKNLLRANPDLSISKWIESNRMATSDMFMTLYIFHRAVSGYEQFAVRDICELVSKTGKDRFHLRMDLLNEKHILFSSKMIAWEGDDIKSAEYFELTDAGKVALLGEETAKLIANKTVLPANGLILPENIKVKNLYYNDREKNEIARIDELINPANYEDVCSRFQGQGMNAGICVLFYGGPGTGKTESVLQLARKSCRPISQIDISTVKDKWVGESEKRAKAIFNEYRKLVKSNKVTPILLLNEADAIINKRINVERSVDQMYNAIQNIFLEEMEKFEGIMIATTNLENNFDPAFDRRFLYKVGFEKPSVEVRAKILQERIQNLSLEEASGLASRFELSGGQVENVARKALTEILLRGVAASAEQIEQYCAEEVGFRKNNPRTGRIGFDIAGND
jgi:hypothetical protein